MMVTLTCTKCKATFPDEGDYKGTILCINCRPSQMTAWNNSRAEREGMERGKIGRGPADVSRMNELRFEDKYRSGTRDE